jgi:four helix bundle protein
MENLPMNVRSYRDLLVWQKAMDVVVESYRIASLLPNTETYGLISQIRRAAVSIPANIAEGHGRDHLGDYLHHLSIANGSLMELETHILILSRLSYLPSNEIERVLVMTTEVSKMIAGLSRSLKKPVPKT